MLLSKKPTSQFTLRAMRIAVALLLAAPAAANPYCSLLPANAPGFEMRAVHQENQWLAEIELVEWVEGARIKLEWSFRRASPPPPLTSTPSARPSSCADTARGSLREVLRR